MLTQKQLEAFLALTEDQVSAWFDTGSGSQDFPGDFPSEPGVYEIYQDPETVYLTPGEDYNPPTIFMEWIGSRQRAALWSRDPRVPSLQTFCGGGFKWRGLKTENGITPFAAGDGEPKSKPVYRDEEPEDVED